MHLEKIDYELEIIQLAYNLFRARKNKIELNHDNYILPPSNTRNIN